MDKKKQIFEDIIVAIIKMPYEFYTKHNISIYKLFEETHYIEYYNCINKKDIKKCLLKNKDYIKYWYDYSSDKRVNNGYYLIKNNRIYEIGFVEDGKANKIKKYLFSINACASFIKYEIEYLRIKK